VQDLQIEGVKYSIIGAEDLPQIANEIEVLGGFAFDLETTALETRDAKIVGIGISYKYGEAFYLPVQTEGVSKWDELKPLVASIFENPKIEKWTHNGLCYDAQVLFHNGVICNGLSDDTMIAHKFLYSETFPNGLDQLCLHYFNYVKIPTHKLIGKGRKKVTFDYVPLKEGAIYGCEDVDYQYRLRNEVLKDIQTAGKMSLYRTYTQPLIQILFDIYVAGFAIDIDSVKNLKKKTSERMEEITKEVTKIAGWEVNLKSPKQVGKLLYDKAELNLLVKHPRIRIQRTPTGNHKTDRESLEKYPKTEKVVRLILEYAKQNKIHGTYAKGFLQRAQKDSDGITRLRTTLAPLTVTARLNSKNPNLQNIPRREEEGEETLDMQIREVFIPSKPDYCLLAADLSQAELRISTHFSGDPIMQEAFLKGEDVHHQTACAVYGIKKPTKEQRTRAKTVNFSVLYGTSPFRLSKLIDSTVPEARTFIAAYFQKLPDVKKYIEKAKEFARYHGFIENMFGRRRWIHKIWSNVPKEVAAAEREAANMCIQSTVADMISLAMIKTKELLKTGKFRAKMILQIHDEIVFEIHREDVAAFGPELKKIMENTALLSVPVVSDVASGNNLLEAH